MHPEPLSLVALDPPDIPLPRRQTRLLPPPARGAALPFVAAPTIAGHGCEAFRNVADVDARDIWLFAVAVVCTGGAVDGVIVEAAVDHVLGIQDDCRGRPRGWLL